MTDNDKTLNNKWKALKSLASPRYDAHLYSTDGGKWGVHLGGVEIGDGHCLTSGFGWYDTPDEAIIEIFKRLTNLKPNEKIIVNSYKDSRREFRWNSFMWEDIK